MLHLVDKSDQNKESKRPNEEPNHNKIAKTTDFQQTQILVTLKYTDILKMDTFLSQVLVTQYIL